MAPALLPNNMDVEIFATVLSETNAKREIDCALQQIRNANLFQERETLERLQWTGSARTYLRTVADHAAKKMLIEAQISRGDSKRIHPIHMLLRSDVASRSVLAEQPVPFGNEYTHLQNCGDVRGSSKRRRRSRNEMSDEKESTDKYAVPYGLGDLGKLATLVGSVDLHQTKRILALLNQYVHGVIRDIVYRCVVLIAGRKKRPNATTSRVGLSDVVYAAKDILGVKLFVEDDANELTKIGRVNAVAALEQSARYLTNAHDSVNFLFKRMFGHESVKRRDVAAKATAPSPPPPPPATSSKKRRVATTATKSSSSSSSSSPNYGRGQGGKLLATMKRNASQALPKQKTKRRRRRSSSSSSTTTSRTSKRRRRVQPVAADRPSGSTIAPLAYIAAVAATNSSSAPGSTPIIVQENEQRSRRGDATTPPPPPSSSLSFEGGYSGGGASARTPPTPATPTDPRIIDGEFIG